MESDYIGLVPETHPLDLDVDLEHVGGANNIVSHHDLSCKKKENHKLYLPLKHLQLEQLPEPWRDEKVLKDLKHIGSRVVHLTVLRLSPHRDEDHHNSYTSSDTSRPARPLNLSLEMESGVRRSPIHHESHEGSGFLTFHPQHGAVIHTSRHVVRDQFEAQSTVVRLFYDDDTSTKQFFAQLRSLRKEMSDVGNAEIEGVESSDQGVVPRVSNRNETELGESWHGTTPGQASSNTDPCLFRADGKYFESFIFSDYTAFSCDSRIAELFPPGEQDSSHFSFIKAGNKKLVLGPQLDGAVISHPHGTPKAIAFGKMRPLTRLLPAMYKAPTCPGSSGAPFIRLHSDANIPGEHYVSAGLFVHHGYYPRPNLNLGMGTVRPPITLSFPAGQTCSEKVMWLWSTLSLCEDFLLLWMLLMFDHDQVEPFIKHNLFLFTLLLPLAGVIFSWDATLDRVLWTGFWTHMTLSLLHWFVEGPHITPTICGTMSAAFSVLMCVSGWLMMCYVVYPLNFFVVIVAWYLAIYLERHFSVHKWVFDWIIQTFRVGKVPLEESEERSRSEYQSSSVSEPRRESICEKWTQGFRRIFSGWWDENEPRVFQVLSQLKKSLYKSILYIQKTTVVSLIAMILSINITLVGIIWTSFCLYVCSSCLRGRTSSIPILEDAFFTKLAQQIKGLKRTKVGRYLSHFCWFPSDIRAAFHWLVRGSEFTETVYGPVTFFLGPAILLVIWMALVIEPPPVVAILLFLLPRRSVCWVTPTLRRRSRHGDSVAPESSLPATPGEHEEQDNPDSTRD